MNLAGRMAPESAFSCAGCGVGMRRRVEELTGGTLLFSEEADSRSGQMLGNIPMIFSHAEYARAVPQLENCWPRGISSLAAADFKSEVIMPETVVITGASAGVGRATAHAFAAQGAQIGLIARGTQGLQAAAAEVEKAGGKALTLRSISPTLTPSRRRRSGSKVSSAQSTSGSIAP